MLEAVRFLGLDRQKTRFYQASTSELYGLVRETPQSEITPFHPRSPYAVAKLYAYWITVNYREAYGLYACNGILFNHESPRRGETFVTRKITRGLAQHQRKGWKKCLYMGNIDALRDWGHAKDYVRMQWMMLQQAKARRLCHRHWRAVQRCANSSSGRQQSLASQIHWSGEGVNETGNWNGKPIVRIDPRYFRPTEVETLLGDAGKARQELGWVPEISAQKMCAEMVASDLAQARQHALLRQHGFDVAFRAE
jgi:GDPmannose 4,6-dehydratase